MNLVECQTPGCDEQCAFVGNAYPDGWKYILPDATTKGRTHTGVGPRCVERAKQQSVKVRGGVNFRPDELEAGTFKDRQKNLFE